MSKNPSIQCSVCGQWKRLTGKDESGSEIRRFYPCCEIGDEIIEHEKPVCQDCCLQACPNRVKAEAMEMFKLLEEMGKEWGGHIDTFDGLVKRGRKIIRRIRRY